MKKKKITDKERIPFHKQANKVHKSVKDYDRKSNPKTEEEIEKEKE